MPSMVRHSFQTMLSVGYYRNLYSPPDSSASFIQDFTRDGQLLQTLYPGTGRRILYKYTKQSRLSEILYDTTQVSFTYEESSGVIKTIHLMYDGFICTIRYRQTGTLICVMYFPPNNFSSGLTANIVNVITIFMRIYWPSFYQKKKRKENSSWLSLIKNTVIQLNYKTKGLKQCIELNREQ